MATRRAAAFRAIAPEAESREEQQAHADISRLFFDGWPRDISLDDVEDDDDSTPPRADGARAAGAAEVPEHGMVPRRRWCEVGRATISRRRRLFSHSRFDSARHFTAFSRTSTAFGILIFSSSRDRGDISPHARGQR